MQVQVKPGNTNAFPLNAFFIKGADVLEWIKELQQINVALEDCDCFPVPGNVANSMSGCLVILKRELHFVHKHAYYQSIHHKVYIPENATLFPQLNSVEIAQLFPDAIYIFHNETGWASLTEKVDWESILTIHKNQEIQIIAPKNGLFIPSTIHRLEVRALPPDEALEQMGAANFPNNEIIDSRPLSLWEKLKLSILRPLFNKANTPTDVPSERSGFMNAVDKLSRLFASSPINSWVDKLEQNYNNLEERNKDELQKLMDLFKRNPEEALKYAIPIDDTGSTRGGALGSFNMAQRWGNFSLGGGSGYGSGSVILPNDSMQRLQAQYHKTATELIKNGAYEKAAFVYLKLLKNAPLAADALEKGGLYSEAAALHIKYNNNKQKAAECYAKGKMYTQAIELYKELGEHEKTGDLYMLISKQEEAFKHYGMVIEEHRKLGKFVMASLVYRNKMNDNHSAQSMLMEGWMENRDSLNCLNLYFSNIRDVTALGLEIDSVYENATNDQNKEVFITALKYQHEKHEVLRERTKEIAYEIVAEQSQRNPDIVSMLQSFNKDEALLKDILRFKTKSRLK